ncbi:MAG: DUF4412 domain-containing protein [Holophagales bacterium]|nr:DUF4412 domain-containing protein [Holophagales bacterium]
MKTFLRLSLGALLLLPLAAAAQWEGTLDMKISGKDVSGTSRATIGRAGARMQIEMTNAQAKEMLGGGMKMVVLSRTAEPDISYMINDAQKSYARIDVKEMQKSIPAAERDRKWTVKKLGADKVAGYACERATVNQEGSGLPTTRSASRRRSSPGRPRCSMRGGGTPRRRVSRRLSRPTASTGCRFA